jgi:hypothetical protein
MRLPKKEVILGLPLTELKLLIITEENTVNHKLILYYTY